MKKTIHFSNETLNDITHLIEVLGIEGYGDIPKAIKFSITYTLLKLKEDEKVIPTLNTNDFALWFSSVKYLKEVKLNNEKIERMHKGNTLASSKHLKSNTKPKN